MSDPARPLIPEAPGARGSRICGILAIVSAVTCVGIPVAIVLGIVALVQQGKAKRWAAQHPGAYLPVTQTGLVTGIIGMVLPVFMLPFAGIVSAIAIPALLGQRELARSKAVNAQVMQVAAEVARAADSLPGPADPAVLLDRVLAEPAVQALRNPYDPGTPSVRKSADTPPPGGISLNWGPGSSASGGFTVIIHGTYRSGGTVREIRKTVDVD